MKYSRFEKMEALLRLEANDYNFLRTEKETGISRRTLYRWLEQWGGVTIDTLARQALKRALAHQPSEYTNTAWAETLVILYQLMEKTRGIPSADVRAEVAAQKCPTAAGRGGIGSLRGDRTG